MEDTLKQLQEYQIEALRKNIDFNIRLWINGIEVPEVAVNLMYSVSDPVTETRTFTTTFSSDVEDKTVAMRMGRIRKFINDIDKQ